MGLRRAVTAFLDTRPRLYFPILRLFASNRYVDDLVNPRTELVVSGFPRSANSYATMAFYIDRPDLMIASHLHAAAEVVAAVRRRLPTVVLIRHPADAIRSLRAAQPCLQPNAELERWLRYYETIEPMHAHFVISPFARTTGDIGGVIDEVNARWGTAFKRFESTESNRARLFAALRESEKRHASHRFGGQPTDRAARLDDAPLALDPGLLARANALHDRFERLSGWRA